MSFVGMVRSVWVIVEWAESHWIIGVISFQKIYGLYSAKHQKVKKWSKFVVYGWVLWVWWVCVGDG